MKSTSSNSLIDSEDLFSYWNLPPEKLFAALNTSDKGLTSSVAEQRLKQYGRNALEERKQVTALSLFLNQFKSPLVLILIFAAIISLVVGEWTDASIVLA